MTPLSRKQLGKGACLSSQQQWKVKEEICGLDSPGQKVRPYLHNNHSEKGWKHSSSGRIPASLVQSFGF
jgi:hypothetical protein